MVRVKDAIRQQNGKRANAFEAATPTRKRHAVVGLREKRGGSSGVAKSQALRRETLLVEQQQQGRTNTVVDGRFGEDESMPLEDKLISRFQRERQRQDRDSKYALEDTQPAGSLGGLTHGGQALGEMDEMSDVGWGDDDDDDERAQRGAGGANNAEFIQQVHFGGGDAPRKSAAELLEETIAKYKLK
eukprot:2253495-Prymnesium_polylepis.1